MLGTASAQAPALDALGPSSPPPRAVVVAAVVVAAASSPAVTGAGVVVVVAGVVVARRDRGRSRRRGRRSSSPPCTPVQRGSFACSASSQGPEMSTPPCGALRRRCRRRDVTPAQRGSFACSASSQGPEMSTPRSRSGWSWSRSCPWSLGRGAERRGRVVARVDRREHDRGEEAHQEDRQRECDELAHDPGSAAATQRPPSLGLGLGKARGRVRSALDRHRAAPPQPRTARRPRPLARVGQHDPLGAERRRAADDRVLDAQDRHRQHRQRRVLDGSRARASSTRRARAAPVPVDGAGVAAGPVGRLLGRERTTVRGAPIRPRRGARRRRAGWRRRPRAIPPSTDRRRPALPSGMNPRRVASGGSRPRRRWSGSCCSAWS